MSNYNLALSVTKELGGEWHGRYGTAPGPGHSKTDRSLCIKPHPSVPDDVVIHSFADDDWQAIKSDLRKRGILPTKGAYARANYEPQAPREKPQPSTDDQAYAARQHRTALWLWGRSHPADGTVVSTYLKNRGIELQKLPATIRYLPPAPPKHPFPAMIAAFGLPDEPEPGELYLPRVRITGVQLTRLHPEGLGKAPVEPQRLMIGSSNGWPIVLAPPNDGLALLIGEGIETVLAGHTLGIGMWSAATAGRLAPLAIHVPDYVEAVTIAVDNDDAGRRGAYALAERLHARGIEVSMMEAGHGT